MSHLRKAPHGRALDRRRADDLLSGAVSSRAPRAESIGFSHTGLRQNMDVYNPYSFPSPFPPSPPPLTGRPIPTASTRLDGHSDSDLANSFQDRRERSPIVIVIEDSDDEVEYNNSSPLSPQERVYKTEQVDQQDMKEEQDQEEPVSEQAGQHDEHENVQQDHQDEKLLFSEDDDEDQEAHHAQQEQVQALLKLPEVNIPETEWVETPRALLCELLAHQRLGLTWLIRQEEDPNRRGSILADGMGLGKTVMALSLILSRQFNPRYPTRRTTLIVVPLALLEQWYDEARSKVTLRSGRKLATIIYHRTGMQTATVRDLLGFDIVLCTYGKLISEYNLHTKGQYHKCRLLSPEAQFFRVILDEAHFIKNRRAQISQAVCQIQAVHRLCMTGTPLMNNIAELYPLIRFLNIEPYQRWEKFSQDLDRPTRKWEPGMELPAMLTLQTFVHSVMLRRNKDSKIDEKRIINLQKRNDIEVYVEFGEEQQAFYNALCEKQKLKFNDYLKAGTVMKHSEVILTWILRRRQACNHPYLTQTTCIPDVCALSAQGMINLALQLPVHVQRSINETRQFRCPKCIDTWTKGITENPVIISPCGHYICTDCYTTFIEENDPQGISGISDEDKFKCPKEDCASIIATDNVLMHEFFVYAYTQNGGDLLLSGDDDEVSSNEDELIKFELDDDTEDEDFSGGSLQACAVVSFDGQRDPEDTCGLFVDPYPNEPDPLGEDDEDSDEVSAPEEGRCHKMRNFSSSRKSTAPRAADSTAQQTNWALSRPSSGGSSVFGQNGSSHTPIQFMKPPPRTPRGSYGNPVVLDDDEEEAAAPVSSRSMEKRAVQNQPWLVKDEIEDENPCFPGVLEIEQTGSSAARSKRKRTASERSDMHTKRAEADRIQNRVNIINNCRPKTHNSIQVDDEEPSTTSGFDTRGIVPDRGQRPQNEFAMVEDEDMASIIHQNRHSSCDVRQKAHGAVPTPRQAADKGTRAMVAYQRRVKNEWMSSAKVEKTVDLLKYIRTKHRSEKTLVFSLWTKYLELLELPLRKAGVNYTIYTGSMKTEDRNAAVEAFTSAPELEVMLISLSAGSCGLNLTAANHIILTEPYWNPFVEEQAIDRAHRLGQEKEVFVYRLLIKNTIEDYIVNLQNKKKNLVNAALCDVENDFPPDKLTLEELREVFGV